MRYPIRAVSKLTGIAIDTLRAWERRYHAVAPTRDDRGRLYSDADIARLRLLHDAVARGHAIGRIAALTDAQLRALHERTTDGTPPAVSAAPDTQALLDALRRLDAPGVEREIGRFAATLAPDVLLRDVAMPLLCNVGDAWRAGQATVAHEHLLSAALRNVLGSLLRVYSPGRAATGPASLLLFATPSGERHELGTLGAAILAATRGAGVLYLGPDMPAREIAASVAATQARVVVLGVTASSSGAVRSNQLKTLARLLPDPVELWIGGRHAKSAAAALGARAVVLEDHDAFVRELSRLSPA